MDRRIVNAPGAVMAALREVYLSPEFLEKLKKLFENAKVFKDGS